MFGSKKNKTPKEESKKSSGKAVPIPATQKVADVLAKGDMSVKDIIAPSYVEVDFNHVKIDSRYYRTLFVVW